MRCKVANREGHIIGRVGESHFHVKLDNGVEFTVDAGDVDFLSYLPTFEVVETVEYEARAA